MRLNEITYQEEPGSTFHHDGRLYDLNRVLALVADRPVQRFAVRDLAWVLDHDTPDSERVSRADLTAPLLVAAWRNSLVVVDGLHRLARAVQDGVHGLPGRLVPRAILDACELTG